MVEMAVISPLLVLMLAGMLEIGMMFYKASALERGLRAGATYAARSEIPMTADTKSKVGNLIKTASMDGGLGVIANNWSETGATYSVTVVSRNVGSLTVPVVRLQASVPYSAAVQQMADYLGMTSGTITVTHEQAFIAL